MLRSAGTVSSLRCRLFPVEADASAALACGADADSSQRWCFSTFVRAERRHEGAMATWHRRADKGLGEEAFYRGLGSDINRSGHSADVDALMG